MLAEYSGPPGNRTVKFGAVDYSFEEMRRNSWIIRT